MSGPLKGKFDQKSEDSFFIPLDEWNDAESLESGCGSFGPGATKVTEVYCSLDMAVFWLLAHSLLKPAVPLFSAAAFGLAGRTLQYSPPHSLTCTGRRPDSVVELAMIKIFKQVPHAAEKWVSSHEDQMSNGRESDHWYHFTASIMTLTSSLHESSHYTTLSTHPTRPPPRHTPYTHCPD